MSDQPTTSELARAIQDVTERAQLIVRDEIELAKAEVTVKATKLAKGAAIGAAAGIFALFGLIYFLHAASWFAWKLLPVEGDDVWLGFLVVAVLLFLLGGVAGLVASKLLKKGAPPTPKMAIEEAQLIRQTVSGGPTPPRVDKRENS